MTLDCTLLHQVSTQTKPPPEGIAALPYGIHRTPGLREWVTLESVALPPIPVWHNDHWGLVSLIAVPVRSNSYADGLAYPLGSRRVVLARLCSSTNLRSGTATHLAIIT